MRQAVVALIIKDSKILAISRRKDPSKYGLIGGKVDPNETLDQALIREVKEEANIDILSYTHIFTRVEPKDPGGEDFETYCYYIPDWVGEPSSSEEGQVKWMTALDLTGINGAFAEYNLKTLKIFKELFPLINI